MKKVKVSFETSVFYEQEILLSDEEYENLKKHECDTDNDIHELTSVDDKIVYNWNYDAIESKIDFNNHMGWGDFENFEMIDL